MRSRAHRGEDRLASRGLDGGAEEHVVEHVVRDDCIDACPVPCRGIGDRCEQRDDLRAGQQLAVTHRGPFARGRCRLDEHEPPAKAQRRQPVADLVCEAGPDLDHGAARIEATCIQDVGPGETHQAIPPVATEAARLR